MNRVRKQFLFKLSVLPVEHEASEKPMAQLQVAVELPSDEQVPPF
jgi:Zn-dependent membrane protease YugP